MKLRNVIFLVALSMIFGGCLPIGPTNVEQKNLFTPVYPPTLTPFQPLPKEPTLSQLLLDTPTIQPTSLSKYNPVQLHISPTYPGKTHLPAAFIITDFPENADIRLDVGSQAIISEWVYALGAHFLSKFETVSIQEIQHFWYGDNGTFSKDSKFFMSPQTHDAFQTLWGIPDGNNVKVVKSNQLINKVMDNPNSFTIIPFEQIDPRLKIIQIDGQSPIHKDFDAHTYMLKIPFSIYGDSELVEGVKSIVGPSSDQPIFPPTNRDPNKLTTLAMTGVTALVRATAWTMEQRGITYPAQEIAPILQTADLTHISNEVPFASDCPFPNPVQEGVVFCSSENYIELLKYIGADIIELTGDHFHDWGNTAMLFTLNIYDEANMNYYGGGENIDIGRQPLIVEHNGNKLAFIGCNAKGPLFARAGSSQPGSVVCDFPYMTKEIENLTNLGYLVIASFQHFEYYSYSVPENMKEDFHLLAEAGAVIVSGSQAHQPHGFTVTQNYFIHYGLGNLFFDQYLVSEDTRKGVIDLHVFYNGRHINTELYPYIFEDFAKPRLMTPDEKNSFTQILYNASDW